MRAIALKCPNCGASLNAAATAPTVTCAYCQTTSRVRPRTAFFEAPVKLPRAPPQLARLPVATQQHSRRWAVGCSLAITGFVALMSLVPMLIINKVKQAATGHDGVSGRMLNWSSPTPLAADVNGDGVTDLIGRLQGLEDTESVHLVAFDGASGKKLWRSETLGTYRERGVVVLFGETLAFVNDRGLARGFSAADGSARWKVKLGEKLERACRANDKTYLVTADERWINLDIASGKAAEARPPAGCAPLPTDDHNQKPTNVTAFDWTDRSRPRPDKLEGMAISEHLIVEGADRLATGYKSPGTSVPMVARYRVTGYEPPKQAEGLDQQLEGLSPKERRRLRTMQRDFERATREAIEKAEFEVVWKTQVPSRDPLAASSSRVEKYGISIESDCVVVPYEVRDKPIHVACLSYKTGEHRWDVALTKAFIDTLRGVTVSADRAFVHVSNRVHVLDLATGKRLFSVGQTN